MVADQSKGVSGTSNSTHSNLVDLYRNHEGKVSDKWLSYLDFYNTLFLPLKHEPVRILEIGVQNGGALEIWSHFFPNAAKIIGCDINPLCHNLTYDDPRIAVVVGDANTAETYDQIRSLSDSFDIVIDDGSHRSSDIVRSFARYFPHIADGGLYVAEDLHCSYMEGFEGGLEAPYSSISFFKRVADLVNRQHWGGPLSPSDALGYFSHTWGIKLDDKSLEYIDEVRFRNSLCVVAKSSFDANVLGPRLISGQIAEVDGAPIHNSFNGLEHVATDETGNPNGPLGKRNEFFVAKKAQFEEIDQLRADLQKGIQALNLETKGLESQLYRERQRPLKSARNFIRYKIFQSLPTLKVPFLTGAIERFNKSTSKYNPTRGLASFETFELDLDCINASDEFRNDFYSYDPAKLGANRDGIRDYLLNNGLGHRERKPMPGFHPRIYAENLTEVVTRNAFADFLSKGQPIGPWLKQVIPSAKDCERAPTEKLRSALHLHIFYPEKIPILLSRIQLNSTQPDLFVSTTEAAASDVCAALKNYQGAVIEVRVVPNRGRNIGPLLTQFGPALVANYDVIGHLHTKNSPHLKNRLIASSWNEFLIENLVGGKHGGAMMDAILTDMESDSSIGAVYPDDPYILGWNDNQAFAEGLGMGPLPDSFNFPVGTMFWVRTNILNKFVSLGLSWKDYPLEPLPVDGTMLHAIERMLGVVAETDGHRSVVTNVRGITRC